MVALTREVKRAARGAAKKAAGRRLYRQPRRLWRTWRSDVGDCWRLRGALGRAGRKVGATAGVHVEDDTGALLYGDALRTHVEDYTRGLWDVREHLTKRHGYTICHLRNEATRDLRNAARGTIGRDDARNRSSGTTVAIPVQIVVVGMWTSRRRAVTDQRREKGLIAVIGVISES